jgi:ankyrin repeat protein
MFNEGMAGCAPKATMNVLRRWFARIDEVMLPGSILHGAISVFDSYLENLRSDEDPQWWSGAVELCFRVRETSPATHRIFTHSIFDDPSVRRYVQSLFRPATHFKIDDLASWMRSIDIATYEMVVEQRGILQLSPDADGVTAFHVACRSRNHILVAHLLASGKGCPLNLCCPLGTPLHCACHGSEDANEMSPADGSDAFLTIKCLLEHDADPREAILSRDGNELSALNVADAIGQEVLQVLYPDVSHNSLGPDGKNGLHVCATRDVAMLRHYIATVSDAVDLETPCREGYRAIHHAAFTRNEVAVMLLADQGASLIDANGQSVLHHAAAGGSASLCVALRRRFPSLNPNDRDSFGQSAIDLAADASCNSALCT